MTEDETDMNDMTTVQQVNAELRTALTVGNLYKCIIKHEDCGVNCQHSIFMCISICVHEAKEVWFVNASRLSEMSGKTMMQVCKLLYAKVQQQQFDCDFDNDIYHVMAKELQLKCSQDEALDYLLILNVDDFDDKSQCWMLRDGVTDELVKMKSYTNLD